MTMDGSVDVGMGETMGVGERERFDRVDPSGEAVGERKRFGQPDASGQQARQRQGAGATAGRRRVVHAGPGLDDSASLDADAREARLDRVAVLYARITAATREFLAAVAECDRHRDFEAAGFGSCAEWLAWRVGLRHNAASERVRVARALEELPLTSESMARGEISFSKVRALTRVATPDSEAELLDFARAGSTADLERIVRAWKTLSRDDEARRERLLHRTRRFSIVPDEDGMYVARGRLSPEVAAVLMRAVDAASDALYRSETGGCSDDEEVEPAQRRADALGLLAERALAAGFHDDPASVSGSRAERYQVMLYVEPETLAEEGEPGMSELEDGTRLAAETTRRLACDSGLVRVTTSSTLSAEKRGGCGCASDPSALSAEKQADCGCGSGGGALSAENPDRPSPAPSALDIGRRVRTVPPALRRALEARDRGCRFPGCGLRFTDAHHIRHWADGGETKIDNLVLLCRRHHRKIHEEGWRVASEPGSGAQVVFFRPDGRAMAAAPTLDRRLDRPLNGGLDLAPNDAPTHRPSPKPNGESGTTGAVAGAPLTPSAPPSPITWRTNLPTTGPGQPVPWHIEARAREALERAGDAKPERGVDATAEHTDDAAPQPTSEALRRGDRERGAA
ncbi:MAG: DUF222 domain-containing protein [Longimicrobiales bacterium]|nr:DUF222 domain-containing protein [Longimicrobiales bacterium]